MEAWSDSTELIDRLLEADPKAKQEEERKEEVKVRI